ncbi:ABC transporter substrate-binding protein [Geodermatophilus sp. CPCC 206100]|uniref:ABC transporter substrate-binding protein n=1 Tax=Geodermatophilus sp. CPCC 206100 TaxID=3020054 RepID=UPI003B007B46
MRHSLTAKAAVAMTAAVCTLALAACGGSEEDAASSAAESSSGQGDLETTEMNVGVQPFAEASAFYYALQEGYFEDEGLTVNPTSSTGGGGATLVTSIVSGDIDVAYANYVSVVQAASEGLPLRIVRENDRPGPQGLYSVPGSGITTPADLAGKRIAINGLGNIMELTSRAALEENGVDPDSVTFVEIPLPEMPQNLSTGDVDAAWLAEPFVTNATNTLGAQLVLDISTGPTEDLPISGWMTSGAFAEENPATMAAFIRALDRGMEAVGEDPGIVGEIVPTFTQIPPEVASALQPSTSPWRTGPRTSSRSPT